MEYILLLGKKFLFYLVHEIRSQWEQYSTYYVLIASEEEILNTILLVSYFEYFLVKKKFFFAHVCMNIEASNKIPVKLRTNF